MSWLEERRRGRSIQVGGDSAFDAAVLLRVPDEGGWCGPRKATGGVERAFIDAADDFRNADLMGADETEALAI